jgi:predicted AAA+ superfamily ATPase
LLQLSNLGDSLAGRIENLYLHPLTAAEMQRKPGRFLSTLLSGRLHESLETEKTTDDFLVQQLVGGGFPEAVSRSGARSRAWHRAYLRTLIERDAREVVRLRDVAALSRMLELLAVRTSTLLNVSVLGNELGLQRSTIDSYLNVLERIFLIRRLLPWHRNESKRLIKSPKIHFVDSGLAATRR